MDRGAILAVRRAGRYFFLTGVWPIVHGRSFMAVTGPKHDVWLVKTVGAVVTVIGLAILAGGLRETTAATAELLVVAVGCAFVLMVVDVVYVLKRVIPPIYLADAVAEAVLLAAWGVWLAGSNAA